MNCFHWQSNLSDYLDGLMIGAQKSEIDDHVEGCKDCAEHYQHYRTLQTLIGGLERYHMPVTLQKSPLERPLAKGNEKPSSSLQEWWIRRPWYVKFLLEGVAVVLVAFVVVKSAQKIIAWQEKTIDDQFEKIDSQPQEASQVNLPPGFAKNAPNAAKSGSPSESASSESGDSDDDSVAPLDDYAEDDEGAGDNVEVGKSEVWRFYLKTDSPPDVRNQVVAILKQLNLFDQTPNTLGMEAPGGIQFDVLAGSTDVATLKHAIEKLNPRQNDVDAVGSSPLSQPFTWYKKKSREPLPTGKARVIIWLSQL